MNSDIAFSLSDSSDYTYMDDFEVSGQLHTPAALLPG
jgi:hypothetical protein